MAIQVRRGSINDLDTSRLVAGEPFVTLDKENVEGGDYYVGITIAPRNVVRLATWDNLSNIKSDCIDAKDEALEAKNDVDEALEEVNADIAHLNSVIAEKIPTIYIETNKNSPNYGCLMYSGGNVTYFIDDNGYLCWGND